MSTSKTAEIAIDGIELDRSDWELVPFGDVALKQNTSVDREETELTYYVNGGHMGSEDLHLREWGELGDEYLGPAFTRKFCEGDILYGSRRTYLRKVAVAHFDGITANTTFVIKPNEERIIKDLLPFVMLSEGFSQHSIRNSKGSVNPYINWKDIANYEFLLPPKDQQAKLAELLWAADSAVQSNLSLKEKLFVQLRTTREHLIGMLDDQRHSLQDLCKKKISYGIVQPGPNIPDGKPFIQSSDLSDDGVDVASLGRTTPEIYEKYIRSEVEAGDILFSLRGNLGEVQFVPGSLPKSNLARGVARVSTNGKVDSSYLIEAIRCERIQRRVRALCTGSTFKEITIAELRGLKVPVPKSLETQAEIAKRVTTVRQTYRAAQAKCSSSKEITKSLINQIF